MTKAFLILANSYQSCLIEANLSHTNLTKANLSKVTGFAEAILNQTILTGALLPERKAGHELLRYLQIWKDWQLKFPQFKLRPGSDLFDLLLFSTVIVHRQKVR